MMADRSARIRELWKATLATTDACVTLEALSRFWDGSLEEATRSRVSSHLDRCQRCRTEVEMLKEFERATPPPQHAAAVSWITAELERRSQQIAATEPAAPFASRARPAPRQERRRSWREILRPQRLSAGAFAFAAVLVVIAAGIYLRTAQEPGLDSDGATGSPVFRSKGVVALAPRGDLGRMPTELRWQPVPGAIRYSVKLMEVDRKEIWQAESNQTTVLLPAEIQEKMVPGKTLLWQVTAMDAAGKSVATSQVESFRIALSPVSNH